MNVWTRAVVEEEQFVKILLAVIHVIVQLDLKEILQWNVGVRIIYLHQKQNLNQNPF